LANAWNYLVSTGAVTDACFTYTSGGGSVPACATTCADKSAYKKYKCTAGSVVEMSTPDQIKSEIFANGPIETQFSVYQDFFNYKSGVYQHVTGGLDGGHAVKILGWGNESGLDYWLCANSWGPAWGLQGFFKIKQGDCGIDQSAFTCTPDLAAAEFTF
jgi:cathepsin B